MRKNKLREIWASGGSVINGWLAIPSAFSAETMAHQGWDSLTVDLQHGVTDYQSAVTMFTAISTTNTVPMARVPWLEPGILMKVFDAGAYGVICPMVNTREDAERLVAYTHYPPIGTRSFGPIRGLLYGGSDYHEHANDTIVVFAMIETKAGPRQPRGDPVGPRPRCRLHRAVRSLAGARLQADLRRRRPAGRRGDRVRAGQG